MKTRDGLVIWTVIPAYNEQKYIAPLLRKAKKHSDHVVVVDDGSIDSTAKHAEKEDVILLTHDVNLGKGAALKTGCEYALREMKKAKADLSKNIIIVMDSDGQHRPEDIPRFIRALKGKDIVFGSRKIGGEMPFVYRMGNSFINYISRILFRVDIEDTQSGFRAFRASVYEKIRWSASDYSIESEMIANVGRKSLKYSEISIDTIYKEAYKGTTIFDGVKIVFNMLRLKIR